jgi:hypothetical protein
MRRASWSGFGLALKSSSPNSMSDSQTHKRARDDHGEAFGDSICKSKTATRYLSSTGYPSIEIRIFQLAPEFRSVPLASSSSRPNEGAYLTASITARHHWKQA